MLKFNGKRRAHRAGGSVVLGRAEGPAATLRSVRTMMSQRGSDN
jgi:hypothetical protein